jgi:aminoglycoside phosphotransferase (APT) family kinase protein
MTEGNLPRDSLRSPRDQLASGLVAHEGILNPAIDKDRPQAAWIAALRDRYPVEAEIDRVLVRKLQQRSGPAYAPQSLDALVAGATKLIRNAHGDRFEIRNSRWLTGGASKLQMAFDLRWWPDGQRQNDTAMVLRMEPAASVCETSRLREHQLLQAFDGIVPVPKPYWVDVEGRFLPYPALIYGFAEGVTKPSRTSSNVSGLGTNLGPELRARLAPQFIEHLALIHRRPLAQVQLPAFDVPTEPQAAARWAVNWWERVWEEDAGEDVPLMRLATAWMRASLPRTDSLSIVHADYRTGNFLFDESQARITAWLDWELGHIGDRHEDLAWSMSRAFGHYAEGGGEFLICGLLPEAEFLNRYEAASGLAVNRAALHFYRVLSAYKAVTIVLAAGYRNARNGKSHQDVLLVWLMGLAAPLLDELRELLEEVF